MKKRAKKKHVRLDPMGWVKNRMPLADDQTRDLQLAYRMALQAMLTGHGDEQAFCTIAASMNIALTMCERGIYEDEIQTIKDAIDALATCQVRSKRTGRWLFTGPEQKAVKAGVFTHDLQCAVATQRQASLAILDVHARVEGGEIA